MAISRIYSNLPNKPGVYLFKNAEGGILYVGKAKDLKKRVSSYFSKAQTDRPWIGVMLPSVTEVETIVVSSELEALMLEATLIKQHLPKFNILLTDDKSYPYIAYIERENIPRFTITRRRHKDGSKYFGPYLSARSAEHTLEFLRLVFGIHFSSRPLPVHSDRPCLNCQLNGFTCPQNGEVSAETYQQRVDAAISFLQGKRKDLVRQLEERMAVAAQKEQFELAGKLRDQLFSIQRILEKQQVISTNLDGYDAVASAVNGETAATALLKVREGRIVAQHVFFFTAAAGSTEPEVTRQFLLSLYPTIADSDTKLVVIQSAIDDQRLVETFLANTVRPTIKLRLAERGDKKQTLQLASMNAQTKLELQLISSNTAYAGLVALKELLQLPSLPNRIEAVDISNLGASEPVGAVVCFIGGVSAKNEYRKYKIKTVEGQNDFAMIREVVRRRFSDTSRPVPDLFVVDGGPEQLAFAAQALTETPLQPGTLISLAKKPDRIFRPTKKRPELVKRGDKGLLLLARIRDEVHRFGITFQRKRQRRKLLSSAESDA